MSAVYKKISIILLLLISYLLNGCALFNVHETPKETAPLQQPSEREQLFAKAEALFKSNNFESAGPLYLKLSRSADNVSDPVHDQSLWRLTRIYEKNNEFEKTLLALNELAVRKSSTLPKNKIKFAQMKALFRLTSFDQAQDIKKEIDSDYKANLITLNELYEYLAENTNWISDIRLLEDLMFLGEVQKYFVFVMESELHPENERLTEHLISNYEHFFAALKQDTLQPEFKKKLSILLFDQLHKFDRYKIEPNSADRSDLSSKTMLRFSDYCEKQLKLLTESFHK